MSEPNIQASFARRRHIAESLALGGVELLGQQLEPLLSKVVSLPPIERAELVGDVLASLVEGIARLGVLAEGAAGMLQIAHRQLRAVGLDPVPGMSQSAFEALLPPVAADLIRKAFPS